MTTIGEPAPHCTFYDQDGSSVTVADFRGSWVVLWWYPEANTPGCSRQASSIEASLDAITRDGTVVLGASFDPAEKNDSFACDKGLRYRLLSDPTREAGAAYGVDRTGEEESSDRAARHTFVIDPRGTLAFREDATSLDLARYGEHVLEVLRDLKDG
ncbi:peroxiredoxin [Microbacterium lacus]|uniref:thioredoxin-dependent peroxiredoxin n=1 Tax=Microbacterium lacus TaxID=415217 RepID=A0ABP4SZ94_9MICO